MKLDRSLRCIYMSFVCAIECANVQLNALSFDFSDTIDFNCIRLNQFSDQHTHTHIHSLKIKIAIQSIKLESKSRHRCETQLIVTNLPFEYPMTIQRYCHKIHCQIDVSLMIRWQYHWYYQQMCYHSDHEHFEQDG